MYLLTNVSMDADGRVYAGFPTRYDTEDDAVQSAKTQLADDFGISVDELENAAHEGGTPYTLSMERDGRLEVYTVAEAPKGDADDVKMRETSSVGTIEVSHNGYGEEYPGISVNFIPSANKDLVIPLAMVEVVEGGRDFNDETELLVRTYVSNEKNGKDMNGEPYKGKISENAPINNVSLTAGDINTYVDTYECPFCDVPPEYENESAGESKTYYISRFVDARYETSVMATNISAALKEFDAEYGTSELPEGWEVVGGEYVNFTDPEGNLHDYTGEKWSYTTKDGKPGRFTICRSVDIRCYSDVSAKSLEEALELSDSEYDCTSLGKEWNIVDSGYVNYTDEDDNTHDYLGGGEWS